jgi:hypothetical protein
MRDGMRGGFFMHNTPPEEGSTVDDLAELRRRQNPGMECQDGKAAAPILRGVLGVIELRGARD